MATQHARNEPVRPAIVVALSQPERTEVVDAITEAGFDTIPLPPGTALRSHAPAPSALRETRLSPEGRKLPR